MEQFFDASEESKKLECPCGKPLELYLVPNWDDGSGQAGKWILGHADSSCSTLIHCNVGDDPVLSLGKVLMNFWKKGVLTPEEYAAESAKT